MIRLDMTYKMTCAICNKVVEGLSERHVETLMLQHQMKHRPHKLKEDTQQNANITDTE